MNPLFSAGLEIQTFLQSKSWPFCFIGGLAVLRWGEQRMTQDVDISVFTGFGQEEKYINSLLGKFSSRIENPLEFAIENRVLLLSSSSGVAIDVSLSALPFEKEVIDRASSFDFDSGCSLVTCSVEDLIVLKAFASRPKDWLDIEGIVIRNKPNLDTKYIFNQLKPLAEVKEAPELLEKLKNLL
jgi:Nucleotidyl transferase AbiEii toxin, Type IV TA system